jgi:hypothetical protein
VALGKESKWISRHKFLLGLKEHFGAESRDRPGKSGGRRSNGGEFVHVETAGGAL